MPDASPGYGGGDGVMARTGRSQMQISSTGLAVSHVSFIAELPSQLPSLLRAPTQAGKEMGLEVRNGVFEGY